MCPSKLCFKCRVEKPLTAFYRHRQMADGHLNKCIECTRRDVNTHRAANLDRIRAYDRARGHRSTPEKDRARNAARRLGKGSHPCSVCGAPRAEAHHEDYSKPLEVIWLCKRHHAERHRRYG